MVQPLPPQFCRLTSQSARPRARSGAARRASPLIPGHWAELMQAGFLVITDSRPLGESVRSMLPLNDKRWMELRHAYGKANDTPDYIKQLHDDPSPRRDYKDEPWFSLWSSLCHQGDVYEASYAALPHIVDVACNSSGSIDLGFFLLPASIEIARKNQHGPKVPEYLSEAYHSAIERLNECVAMHRNESWDQYMLIAAFSAQAVSKGHHRVAEAILNLDDSLIDRLIDLNFD